jgi:hypothetical protein
MDVKQEWKDEVLYEIDKAIQRGNVDKDTLQVMKELLKGAKAKVSMTEYFKQK